MSSVLIRKTQLKDLTELVQLAIKFIQSVCSKDYNSKQIQALVDIKKQRKVSKDIILVATSNEQIVGFATISNNGRWLNGLFIHPNFVRRGIGTRLIAAIESEAIKKNYKCCTV